MVDGTHISILLSHYISLKCKNACKAKKKRYKTIRTWDKIADMRIQKCNIFIAFWAPYHPCDGMIPQFAGSSSSHHRDCFPCSVTKLYPTLCNPIDHSTPGFPVLHYLPEIAQTHVHWFSHDRDPDFEDKIEGAPIILANFKAEANTVQGWTH